MTENELLEQIRSSSLAGIYFFYGEEDYMKNHRAAEIKKLVTADDPLADFNTHDFSFGDGEIDLPALADALLSPPMMAERKFVGLYFSDLDSIKEKEKSAMLALLRETAEADTGDTVVLIRVSDGGFDAGQPKKPSAFLREAEKFMNTVRFDHQPNARLHRWIARHFAEYGVTISPYVAEMIVARAGRAMYRLSGEVAKCAAYVAASGRREALPADVTACVSLSEEEDAFALANCVIAGDTAGALSALGIKERRRDEPVAVLGQITRVFSDLAVAALFVADGRDRSELAREAKMHEYKAGLYHKAARSAPLEFFADMMKRCEEADLAMKTGGGSWAVLKQLICGANGFANTNE